MITKYSMSKTNPYFDKWTHFTKYEIDEESDTLVITEAKIVSDNNYGFDKVSFVLSKDKTLSEIHEYLDECTKSDFNNAVCRVMAMISEQTKE